MGRRTCADVMRGPAAWCHASDTLAQAVRAMRGERDGRSITVVAGGDGRRVTGTIDAWDIIERVIAEALDPATTPVHDVMRRDIVSCRPEQDVDSAVAVMRARGIAWLPVVDPDGRLLGTLARADVETTTRELPISTWPAIERIPGSSGL